MANFAFPFYRTWEGIVKFTCAASSSLFNRLLHDCDYLTIAQPFAAAHTEALATKLAGEDARRQLVEQAAIGLNVKPGALEIEDGGISVKDNPDMAISIRRLAAKVGAGSVLIRPVSFYQ